MQTFSGRTTRLGVLSALLLALIPGTGAAAKHGLVHSHSKLKSLPAGTVRAATAKCPDGSDAVGGGLLIEGVNTATGVHSSYPVDDGDKNSKPDDGWRGVANSRSAGDKGFRVEAVCSTSGHFTYTAGTTSVPNGMQAGVYGLCVAGNPVAGGGVKLGKSNAALSIAASYPWDADMNTTPDDGWYGTATNQSGSDQSITTYAICARSGAYDYESLGGSAGGFNQGTRPVPCPNGTGAVSGGAVTETMTATVEIAQTGPYGNGAPDDGWVTNVSNQSGVPLNFTAFAVCRA